MLQLSFRYQSSDEEMGGRSVEEYIKTKLYNFGIMNTVRNLFHQIEQIFGPKDMGWFINCNFLALYWPDSGESVPIRFRHVDMSEESNETDVSSTPQASYL